jgi:hypothetical protein
MKSKLSLEPPSGESSILPLPVVRMEAGGRAAATHPRGAISPPETVCVSQPQPGETPPPPKETRTTVPLKTPHTIDYAQLVNAALLIALR